jgi:hypothetical protein
VIEVFGMIEVLGVGVGIGEVVNGGNLVTMMHPPLVVGVGEGRARRGREAVHVCGREAEGEGTEVVAEVGESARANDGRSNVIALQQPPKCHRRARLAHRRTHLR